MLWCLARSLAFVITVISFSSFWHNSELFPTYLTLQILHSNHNSHLYQIQSSFWIFFCNHHLISVQQHWHFFFISCCFVFTNLLKSISNAFRIIFNIVTMQCLSQLDSVFCQKLLPSVWEYIAWNHYPTVIFFSMNQHCLTLYYHPLHINDVA